MFISPWSLHTWCDNRPEDCWQCFAVTSLSAFDGFHSFQQIYLYPYRTKAIAASYAPDVRSKRQENNRLVKIFSTLLVTCALEQESPLHLCSWPPWSLFLFSSLSSEMHVCIDTTNTNFHWRIFLSSFQRNGVSVCRRAVGLLAWSPDTAPDRSLNCSLLPAKLPVLPSSIFAFKQELNQPTAALVGFQLRKIGHMSTCKYIDFALSVEHCLTLLASHRYGPY